MGLDHHKGSASIRPIRTLTETSESQRSVNSSSRLTRKRLLPRPSAGGSMSKGVSSLRRTTPQTRQYEAKDGSGLVIGIIAQQIRPRSEFRPGTI